MWPHFYKVLNYFGAKPITSLHYKSQQTHVLNKLLSKLKGVFRVFFTVFVFVGVILFKLHYQRHFKISKDVSCFNN